MNNQDEKNSTAEAAQPASTNLQQLKALALAADQGEGQHIYTHWRDSNNFKANEAWHHAASPAVVLDLIARIERAAAPAPLHDWRAIAIKAGACAHCGRLPSDTESCDWMECPAGAVSAATKPTAYLSSLKPNAPLVYAPVQAAAYRHGYKDAIRAVQSLLATKPAAQAVPEGGAA